MFILLVICAVIFPPRSIQTPIDYQRPTDTHIYYDAIGNRLIFEWTQQSSANVIWVSKEYDGYDVDVIVADVIDMHHSVIDAALPEQAVYRLHECYRSTTTGVYVWCIKFEQEFYFVNPKPYRNLLPILTIS